MLKSSAATSTGYEPTASFVSFIHCNWAQFKRYFLVFFYSTEEGLEPNTPPLGFMLIFGLMYNLRVDLNLSIQTSKQKI